MRPADATTAATAARHFVWIIAGGTVPAVPAGSKFGTCCTAAAAARIETGCCKAALAAGGLEVTTGTRAA